MIVDLDVTQHAIRRYFERVLECDCEWPLRRGYGEAKTIEWAAKTYGHNARDVRIAIYREVRSLLPVTAFVRGSDMRLRGASCIWFVQDGHRIVTCLGLSYGSRKDARDVLDARRARCAS